MFGKEGVLKDYEPWQGMPADPRLYDMTVEQLLVHRAGWDSRSRDESALPLYDPLLNTVYLDRGVRLIHKLGQISPKWDNSGTFPDQISAHFGSVSRMYLDVVIFE